MFLFHKLASLPTRLVRVGDMVPLLLVNIKLCEWGSRPENLSVIFYDCFFMNVLSATPKSIIVHVCTCIVFLSDHWRFFHLYGLAFRISYLSFYDQISGIKYIPNFTTPMKSKVNFLPGLSYTMILYWWWTGLQVDSIQYHFHFNFNL